MRLEAVTVKDFKRFTSLTVEGIPESARLILLTGPNGSGKSSFFDALTMWHSDTFTGRRRWDADYHSKVDAASDQSPIQVTCHHDLPDDTREQKKLIYVRTAYRNDPDYQAQHLEKQSDPLDRPHVYRMIDNDATIGKNYQRLASRVFDIFDAEPMMTDEFTEAIIKPIRDPPEVTLP